jgi:hypothetical protein
MAQRMQQRRGTAEEWTLVNPILAIGEIGYETDTNSFKMGDGTNAWADLSYFQTLDGLGTSLDDYIPVTDKGVADGVATLDSTGNVPINQLGNIIDSAPAVLDTLNELAAAMGDDPQFLINIDQNLTDAVNQLNTSIGQTLTDAEAYADGLVAQEVLNRDGAIASAIATEVVDRDLAIAAETTARQNADSDLNISITAAYEAADTALNTALEGYADAAAGTAQTNAETTAQNYTDAQLDAHNLTTLNVHGIADTGALATQTYADDAVSSHNLVTTNVHGIADTSALATTSDVATAKQEAIDAAAVASELYADGLAANYEPVGTAATAVSTHEADTTSVHGIADTSKLVVTDGANTQTISGDLTVTGNFTVSGTTTTVDVADLVVSDPLIYIGEGNSANLVDLGLVSSFDDGTYQHAGIVRDASDSKWKLFKGVTDEPTTTINFSQGSLDDLAVNNVEVAGVVFSDGTQTKQGVPSITTISQKTAGYTLSSLTERDTIIEIADASSHTLTIPSDSTLDFPVGTTLDVIQTGGGQVTIAGAQGVTVNATPGLKLRTQWSSATLLKRAANTWLVFGDLSA